MDINELGTKLSKEINNANPSDNQVDNLLDKVDNKVDNQPKIIEQKEVKITEDNGLKSSLKSNENKEVKNVSFSDELRNRKKELKENIKETIETKQQTNKILSFLHNNIQTIIFAIFMVILCILFHIYHRNNIKTEWIDNWMLFFILK